MLELIPGAGFRVLLLALAMLSSAHCLGDDLATRKQTGSGSGSDKGFLLFGEPLSDHAAQRCQELGCFQWHFENLEFNCTTGLRGELILENACGVRIAFITEPWELRLRLRREQHFSAEWVAGGPYSRLYLVKRDVGQEDMYVGDGGMVVHGLPGYIVVVAGERRSISMEVAAEALASVTRGQYTVFAESCLLPLLSPSRSDSAPRVVIPVGGGTAAHNKKHAGENRVYVNTCSNWSRSLEATVALHECQ